jgi:hypothetical protein
MACPAETQTIAMLAHLVGSESSEVSAKQSALLHGQLPFILLANSVNSAILALTHWNQISHGILLSWFASIQVTALLRYILLLHGTQNPGAGNWDRRFFAGTLISGACWGAGGLLLFAAGSIPHQTFLTFVLGGMSAGAIATLSADFRLVLAYVIPAMLPLAIRFFIEPDQLHLAMGSMVVLFMILVLNISWRWYRTMLTSLTLEVTNGQLVAQLQSEIVERQQIEADLKTARNFLEERVRERTAELQFALDNVKVLRGLLPICSCCKKIRDDQGYWTQLETYIHRHSGADFTHGLCPDCGEKLFQEHVDQFG